VKAAPKPITPSMKVKGIGLVEGDHNIDSEIDGFEIRICQKDIKKGSYCL
jgi:uncharacterized Zn ribbon protein